MYKLFLLIVLPLFITACESSNNGSVKIDKSGAWETVTPESQGFDSEILADMLQRVQEDNLAVNSIILMKNGKLILEVYRHPYHVDSLFNVMSVTKSIVSAMTGIALDRKVFTSLNEPLITHLKEYDVPSIDDTKRHITILHALTMTTGLDCNDSNNKEMGRIMRSSDWVAASLACPQIYPPGTAYGYSSLATHLLGAALTEATSRDLLNLSTEWLFEPLEMDEVLWEVTPEGYRLGGGWIWMKARDMLRFGKLYLDGGEAKNSRVVSQEWIEKSIVNQVGELAASTEEISGEEYGYGWWVVQGSPIALGVGGQTIFLIPELDIVAVITQANESVDLLSEYIAPALKSYLPTWPNQQGVEKLNTLVAQVAQKPIPSRVKPIPTAAWSADQVFSLANHSTKIYHNGFNNPTVDGFRLSFKENSSQAEFTLVSKEHSTALDIGLDGVARLSDAGTFGRRPDGQGTISLQGEWISTQTFEFTLVELGYPQVEYWQLTFNDGGFDIKVKGEGSSAYEYSFRSEADI